MADLPSRVALGLLLAALVVIAACVPHRSAVARAGRATTDDDGATIVDETFTGRPFDTGIVSGRCYTGAPWGGRSWGIEGSTFSRAGVHTLAAQRFVSSGHDGYLWGRDDSGDWGFVRWVQGSAWAESNCGPTPWRRFRPLDTWGKRVDLGFRVRREGTRLLRPGSDWVLFAINVWLSSPNVQRQGDSLWGRKPLVMDLAVHHETTSPTGRLRNFEDLWAFHYQTAIGVTAPGRWERFDVPLSTHVAAAVQAFGLGPAVERTLQITQVEFVIELRHAEGAARIDDFTLRAE